MTDPLCCEECRGANIQGVDDAEIFARFTKQVQRNLHIVFTMRLVSTRGRVVTIVTEARLFVGSALLCRQGRASTRAKPFVWVTTRASGGCTEKRESSSWHGAVLGAAADCEWDFCTFEGHL